MKEEQFDSQVKELFHDESIPPIVKRRMTETYEIIEKEGKEKRNFFSTSLHKGLRAAVIGCGLITVSTIGVFASQGFQLFDSDGDVMMKLSDSIPEIKEWDLETAEKYKEKVKPGEALVYYIVSDYPEKNFVIYRQQRMYTDFQIFKESIHHSYVPSKTLPFGLYFKSGKITVDADQDQFETVQSELYTKAKTSEEEVLAKIIDVEEKEDQIVAVTEYENDDVEVFVRSSSKVELYENMPLNDGELLISKVKINNHEAFYLKQENGEFPYQSVLWIQEYDGKKIMYEVMTYSLNKMTKEDVMKISESVVK